MVFTLSAAAPSDYHGGVSTIAKTCQPVLQIGGGILLVNHICAAVWSFTLVGLVEFRAVFSCYPLTVTALLTLFLGEGAGWQRWLVIVAGMGRVIIAIRQGNALFDLNTLLPMFRALWHFD